MTGHDDSRSEGEQDESERVTVGIAECKVTTDGSELTTSGLGSCIGVALYDPRTGIAGLVHVMLPAADDMTHGNAAKFADTGIALLVDELDAAGANRSSIEAKLAGGSDILNLSGAGSGISDRNLTQVYETLEEYDITVAGEDVGGEHSRSLRLEPQTGDLVVESGSREERRL